MQDLSEFYQPDASEPGQPSANPHDLSEFYDAPSANAGATQQGGRQGIAHRLSRTSKTKDYSHLGDFEAGSMAGFNNMKAMWNGFLAATGEAVGSDDLREHGLRGMEAAEAEANLYQQGRSSQVEDIDGVGSFLDYAQYTLGSLAPFALESALSAIAGAAIGSSAPGAGTVVGGLGGFALRKQVKDALRNYAKKQVRDQAEEMLAKQMLTKAGAAAGAIVGGYPLHVGDAYNETIEAGSPNAGAAFGAAVPMAALDAVVPAGVAGRLMGRGAGSVAARAAKGAVVDAGKEGLTELGQEEILLQLRGQLDPDFDLSGPEAKSRRWNAGVAGALGGGTTGGVSGAMSRGESAASAERDAAPVEDLSQFDPLAQDEPAQDASEQSPAPLLQRDFVEYSAPDIEEMKAKGASKSERDLQIEREVESQTIPFQQVDIAPPERAALVENDGTEIEYRPPEPANRTDELAGNLERQITDTQNAYGRAARSGRLPDGLRDGRLLRMSFRDELQNMSAGLVKGGDVSYVRGANDQITGRTPSVNPDWFKAMSDDPELSMSTDDVKRAVDKALKAERLGVRQARVVGAMLDNITGRREEYGRKLAAQREAVRGARKRVQQMRKLEPADLGYDPATDAGEVYQEPDYLAEAAYADRAIAEMADDAINAGASYDDVSRVIDNQSTVSAIGGLQRLILRMRNEHRQSVRPAQRDAGRRADDGTRPGDSEAAAGSLAAETAGPAIEAGTAPGAEARAITGTADQSPINDAGRATADVDPEVPPASQENGMAADEKPLTDKDSRDAKEQQQTDVSAAEENGTSGKKAGGGKFTFAGERAKTAPAQQLETARSRVEAGEDQESVRKDTGWFQGADGKWRFEIDDSKARFRGYDPEADQDEVTSSNTDAYLDWVDEAAGRDNGIPLSQVLHHPDLIRAYPQIGAIRVKVDKARASGGFFAEPAAGRAGGLIVIGDPYAYESGPGAALSVLLHEVQHAIQSVEGFAKGGTVNSVIAARDTARKRMEYWSTVASLRQSAETDFSGDIDKAAEQLAGLLEVPIDRDMKSDAQNAPSVSELQSRARKAEREFLALYRPADYYQRLAGEVEARNVEARQKMSGDERRSVPPMVTQDVADSDVIISWNGVEMASDAVSQRQAAGMTVEAVESAVSGRVLQFKNSNIAVRVVADAGALPDSARYLLEDRGDEVAPRGYFDPHDNTVYLVASQIGSEQEALTVLEHEAVGHLAVEAMLGAEFRPFIERVNWLYKHGDKTIREAARQVAADYGPDWKALDAHEQGAEIVAKLAEMRLQGSDLTKRARDLWTQIVQAMRTFFEGLGFSRTFSENDVAFVLLKADAYLRTDREAKAGRTVGAFSKVPSVHELILKAQQSTRGNDSWVDYREVSELEAEQIQIKTGIDVRGFKHSMDEASVRHALAKHGDERAEAERGNAAVTLEDLERVPAIIATADSIEKGETSESGVETILYKKREGSDVYIVEEVRNRRKKLAFKTMYKVRIGKSRSRALGSQEGPQRTSETLPARGTDSMAPVDGAGKPEDRSPAPRAISEDGVAQTSETFRAHDDGSVPPKGKASKRSANLDAVKAEWVELGVDGRLSERDGTITLGKIVVPEEGRSAGTGTKAMQALIKYADQTNQRIVLSPSEDFGGTKKRLLAFYKRFGFLENAGRNKDFTTMESMYRYPNSRTGKFSKSVATRQRDLSADADKGMPIDRLFRKAFDVFGLVKEDGTFKPPAKAKELAAAIGEAGGSVYQQMPWMHPFMEAAKRGLIDNYGLSDEYRQAKRRMGNDKRIMLMEGNAFLEGLREKGVKGHEEAKILHAILTGKDVDREDLKNLAEPIRVAIDAMGQQAVDLGLISEESYQRNVGSYLHRSYLKHETDKGGLTKWASQTASKRRHKIIGNQLKGRGFNIAATDEALGDLKNAGNVRVFYGPKGRKKFAAENAQPPGEGWVDRGVFEVRRNDKGRVVGVWRDWTEAERVAMGEIVDARYAIAKTYQLMANDLATGRFYKTIAENPEWSKDVLEDGDTEATRTSRFGALMDDGDWVLVPDTKIPKSGAKRWGPLAGKYVRAEIWRDLNEADAMNRPTFWKTLMTAWKLNKTARNPVVHMNNIMSNLMFMDLADVRWRDLRRGIQSLRDKDADYEDALKHGAFGSGFVDHELRRNKLEEILAEIEKQATNKQGFWESNLPQRIKMMGKMLDIIWEGKPAHYWGKDRKVGLKPADQWMLDAYQVEDEAFRMAVYLRRRGLGDDAETAALVANEQFLNYEINAPLINLARQTVLPFIAYTYRAVPVIAKSLAERPWKIAKYIAVAEAINALGYAMAPGDEDEERRALRDDQQGRTWFGVPRMLRMPWKDEHGDPVFLDIRRWVVAGDIFDTNVGQAAIPIPAPIQWSGPLMLAAELMLNKQAFTGKEIVNHDTDGGWDKVEKVSDWAWKSWMPGAAWIPNSWYWDKIDTAIDGGMDGAGRAYSLPLAVASSVGIKLQPHNVELQRGYQEMSFDRTERALKYELAALKRERQRNKISDSEYQQDVFHIQKKLKTLEQRRREVLQGAGD